MKLWPIVLVPFALASGSGESYQWQSLGGEAGDMPRFEMVESDLGHFVADVVAIIGTLDIVLGEIDR